jgi:L-alanine-DL-glutamate epimerase-like enolase superfamily enzyme
MVDTNCPWSVDEALAMAEKLRPFDMYWLEETGLAAGGSCGARQSARCGCRDRGR